MKRKLTITITGEDGASPVDFNYTFDPPLDNQEGPPASGWTTAVNFIMDATKNLVEKNSENLGRVKLVGQDGKKQVKLTRKGKGN